jgi:hypothetical protein
MPIQFNCSCGRKLQASEEHVGRRVRCPACGAEMAVPAGETAVQPSAAAAAPKPSAVQPKQGRPKPDDEDDDRPRRSSRREEEERDENRSRRRRREDDDYDDDEHDRPRRRRRREDDDYDDDHPRGARRTSGKATAALVLGVLGVLGFLCLAGVPAIILALLSFGDVKRGRGRVVGQGMAIAGLLLGLLSLAMTGLIVPAVWRVRDASARVQSANNLKQLGLGVINDADSHGGQWMAQAVCDKDGKPLLSWRVAILPYIEQDALYRQFKLDEPWDGPNNIRLLPMMPHTFAHPGDADATVRRGQTHYRVFTGPSTPWTPAVKPYQAGRSSCRFPASFTDGTSNTILIVEAADAVPWTKPDELPYAPNQPVAKLGLPGASTFVVVMADGSTRMVNCKISEQTLRAAITKDGNDLLGPDW